MYFVLFDLSFLKMFEILLLLMAI